MLVSTRTPRRREYLTVDGIEKLFTTAKRSSRNPERDYAILLMMFRHGLRVSELCSLKLSDVNLEIKEFHVSRLKGCDSGPHELYNGESQAIKAWLVQRTKMNPPRDVEELVITERRKGFSRFGIWIMIRDLAAATGLEHLFHSPAHAAPQLRLRPGQQGHRYPHHPGLSRTPFDQLDHPLHPPGPETLCPALLASRRIPLP